MKIDRHLLVRYFLGRCSSEEKEIIRLWLESGEAHRQTFVHERIRFDASVAMSETGLPQQQPVRAKSVALTLLKAAAVVLLLVGSSYFFNLYRTLPVKSAMQSLYVPPGNRAFLTLPDSSSVWLNSNSTLSYPAAFDGKARTVELDGEAYFEVAKRNGQSFVVKTEKYHVEALGTSFNVDAYAGKPDFSTTLYSGKVILYNEQSHEPPLCLNPGESAALTHDLLQVSPIKTGDSHWREGLIVIEDRTFEEIMQLFEKYFGQQIVVENNRVKTLSYRGKLRIADGVEHALRVLQKDFRFAYRRDEDLNIIRIH
ncbi:MAG: FecR domain-containing protein [Tannerella sp.]|jgi:ferric-dicitrate binding protein FerR (iron transport regulator)|nr:FecR domain-containing protein [Tannerella sp.]